MRDGGGFVYPTAISCFTTADCNRVNAGAGKRTRHLSPFAFRPLPVHCCLGAHAVGPQTAMGERTYGIRPWRIRDASQGRIPYVLGTEGVKTSVFENLSQHVADINFNDFLYWCEQCDLQFCTSSELYLHFQEYNCDEQYLCQFCEHETNDPEDLHSLVVNEHACKLIELSDTYNNSENGQFSLLNQISFDKSKNVFVCQVCGFRSRLHANVNRHVAIEHTHFFPYVCDDCGKGFSGMLEYTKHLNLHLSEGVFMCQYCEYSTGQLEDLKTHLDFRYATNLPYKYNECLLRFGSDSELKNHLQTHEKP